MPNAKSDHAAALEAYDCCARAADENQKSYLEDYRFWLMDEQWPDQVKAARNTPGQERPMLTVNRGPAFGRQVVNDIRQNRPAIKTRPADSGADIETALVMQGLIKNIEYTSRADVARDNAAHCAVHGGFGFYKIDIDYACDDTFDLDILVKQILNPLSVLGDPYSTGPDSLDWNMAFEEELMTPDAFKEAYPNADPVSFAGATDKVKRNWSHGDDILVASYWKRTKAMKPILLLSDGRTVPEDQYNAKPDDGGPSDKDLLDAAGVTVVRSRQIETYVVDQCILNGQEVLTDKIRWVGKYIPIIPVYGEELNDEGKRIFRSMLSRAKDPQRQLNYWTTTATELVALAPRVPYIGEEGFASVDPRWATANSQNHAYLEYKRSLHPPQRQPLDMGGAAGAISEAMRASDDMKAVLGMYDASLGNQSNETSGVAIARRQKEGDVGNFHFSDNLSRAIQCEGTQFLDLIPKVYTKGRIARVMGDDGAAQNVQLGPRQVMSRQAPGPNAAPPKIGALQGVFDLALGKYDVYVESGPSYTTQRQETAAVVGELIRANPAMMQIGGDIMVKNLDLKDGDELARRMNKMLPPQLQDNGEQQIPPQVLQALEQQKQAIAELGAENQKLKQDEVGKVATIQKAQADKEKNQVEMAKTALERDRLPIEAKQADVELMQKQIELEQVRAQLVAAGLANAPIPPTPQQAPAIPPKRKRMTLQKINGVWHGESVEEPAEMNGAM